MNNNQFINFVAAAPDQYKVLWWIVMLPLIGAVINGLFGKRIGREGVYIVGVATVATSFLLSIFAFVALLKAGHVAPEMAGEGAEHAAPHAQLSYLAWEWLKAPVGGGAAVPVNFRYVLDSLSGIMLLVVTGVGTLIHVYSTGYMAHDEGYARFFAYLNLFMFSMLNLILGDSLVLLFVGWEGVGLCSYLLIGFWFSNSQYASAGRKAFIVNRIGDVGFLLGMTVLAWKVGAYDFGTLRESIQTGAALHDLAAPADLDKVISQWVSSGFGAFPPNMWIGETIYNLIPRFTWGGFACLCLFIGCTGKSAQLPLYVWLPDAMAGPTPVSALIHAATMVTAGVYLLCRLSFLFVHFPSIMAIIAITGAVTALFAATIALAQNELKKVLAYSTVSQLGFMFLGCGVGAFGAGLFHVYTHAMFKACLFLGAGAVMHACRDKQDLRELGGLRKYLPYTYATFAVATLAIIGVPGFSGFFSKDEILFRALASHNVIHIQIPQNLFSHGWADAHPDANPNIQLFNLEVGHFAFALGVIAATLTAFYMCRLLFLTFWGDFKGWSLEPVAATAGAAGTTDAKVDDDHAHDHDHAASHDDHSADAHGHDDHGHGHGNPWDPPKDNAWNMTGVLVVLGVMSLIAGYIGLPYGWTGHESVIGKFLEPSVSEWHVDHVAAKSQEWIAMALGFSALVVGAGAAYFIYVMNSGKPAKDLVAMGAVRPLYRLVIDKWRIDELYDFLFVGPLRWISSIAAAFFDRFVDWVVMGLPTAGVLAVAFYFGLKLSLPWAVIFGVLIGCPFGPLAPKLAGAVLRKAQTGAVQTYGAIMAFGLLAVLCWMMAVPTATIAYRADGNHLSLQAYGGPGYSYRWDLHGGTDFHTCAGNELNKCAPAQETTCAPEEQPDGRRTCRVAVQVTNAFGVHSSVTRTIEIPTADTQERR